MSEDPEAGDPGAHDPKRQHAEAADEEQADAAAKRPKTGASAGADAPESSGAPASAGTSSAGAGTADASSKAAGAAPAGPGAPPPRAPDAGAEDAGARRREAARMRAAAYIARVIGNAGMRQQLKSACPDIESALGDYLAGATSSRGFWRSATGRALAEAAASDHELCVRRVRWSLIIKKRPGARGGEAPDSYTVCAGRTVNTSRDGGVSGLRALAVTGCGIISTDFMTKNDGNRLHPDRDGERAASYSVTVDRDLIQALVEAAFNNTAVLVAAGEDRGAAAARLVTEAEIEGGIERFDATAPTTKWCDSRQPLVRVTFTRSTVPTYGPLTTGRNGIGQYAIRVGVQSYGRGKPHGIALKSVRASVHVTTPVPSYFDIDIGKAEGLGDGDSALTPDVNGTLATMGHQRSVTDTIQYLIGMGIDRTAAGAIVKYADAETGGASLDPSTTAGLSNLASRARASEASATSAAESPWDSINRRFAEIRARAQRAATGRAGAGARSSAAP